MRALEWDVTRCRVREHDRELVPAEPEDTGASAVGGELRLHRADALADGLQQPVARGVAEGIVDHLEIVQVEEQDGEPLVRLPTCLDLAWARATRGSGVGCRVQ